MLNTIPVPTVRLSNPTPTPESVLQATEGQIPATARKLFTLLHSTAVHALSALGRTSVPNQHVIHQPVEVMAVALAVSRVTLYKHLKTLRQLGLVDSRGHTGSWFGLSRKTGTLFAVSLKPGHTARVRFEDMRHKHRDLQADTMGTRTAWKFLQGLQSHPREQDVCGTALKAWAVTPGNTSTTRSSDCKGGLADTVYSLETLSSTHKSRRAELINSFAVALARGFLDSSNLNFWRKLLWDCLKCDWEGMDTIYRLQCALTRLRADVDEWTQLERPGALLVHRLKVCGLWDTLRYS